MLKFPTAEERGKNILPGPTSLMNPPPRSSPSGTFHGCDGDGCGSDPNTFPLHHMIHGSMHCRFCSSCILLSQRSLYCCRCFYLITKDWKYDHGDRLIAPPAPTVTCQVCRDAVAHVPCLHPEEEVFVCPACTAAQNGTPFTYAPPCKQPLNEREARVLVLGARIAAGLLWRHADAARAKADRLAQEAKAAWTTAHDALVVAQNLAAEEDPSWIEPLAPEDGDLAASEEGGDAEANVQGERRNAMPSLGALTISTEKKMVPVATAENRMVPVATTVFTRHTPQPSLGALTIRTENRMVPVATAENRMVPWATVDNTVVPVATTVFTRPSLPLFDLNYDMTTEVGETSKAGSKRKWALNPFDVKEAAMAAAEAARASLPVPRTLQLFPIASNKMSPIPEVIEVSDDDDEM